MAALHRLLPPGDGKHATEVVGGRTYSCAVGSSIDVPASDAYVLMANGWFTASPAGADVTANRPSNPPPGSSFHDTTLGLTITWDGKAWRNPTSGAAV